MIEQIEREYLIRLAERRKRDGLGPRATLAAVLAETPMAQPGAARCAVRHVFQPRTTHSAASF